MISKLIILIGSLGIIFSCTTVKPYKMQKINDPDMSLSSKSSERFESIFQTYREGSAGANGGKTGGGCGCN
ncbi:MAG: DUF4266 domain-containing protein [Flavobacteriales bacterium]|nr:DUF4266 domain-containing protein [Flavobacteriales bacterium]